MLLLLAALALGQTQTSVTARQGHSLDGGYNAWAVEVVSSPASTALTDTQLRASPVVTSQPDGGVLASDDAAQRSAADLAAIRQLLEQLIDLQQQQLVQLQTLKDPGR